MGTLLPSDSLSDRFSNLNMEIEQRRRNFSQIVRVKRCVNGINSMIRVFR
jgi:hypothetical protein